MDCTNPQSTAQTPHRRALSESANDPFRHKPLPGLPHEIEAYRSRSLPQLPSETSKRNNRPVSRYAPKVSPYKNRPLPPPPPPLQKSEPDREESRTVKTFYMMASVSFFSYWSQILLLKYESVGRWEEKLTFAREMQDCWTKRRLFAHEVLDCASNCACGRI